MSRKKEEENARARVMSCYMDKISPQLSRETASLLPAYVDKLGETAALYAIENAIDNNARKWPYIKAILQDLSQAGVHNAQSLERYRAERSQRAEQSKAGAKHEKNGPGNNVFANLVKEGKLK